MGGLCTLAAVWLLAAVAPWPETPDGLFHLQRSRALAEALRMGILYPRWFPDFAFGYGYPVLHYYAPAAYYPPALLHLAGLDPVQATRVALAAVYALSGAATYLALRSLVLPPAALAGSLLYLAFPYRLYDLGVRGALPEFSAFLWLPLLLWASSAVLRPPAYAHPPAWRTLPAVGLAVAWAGLVLSHNLTALMALILLVAAVPVTAALPAARALGTHYAPRLGVVTVRLGLPALAGGLLSAFYSLPALLEARWVAIGATALAHGYRTHFAGWRDLWQAALRYNYPTAADATVPLPGFVLPLLMLGVVALLWPGRHRQALSLALGGALLTIWLTTGSSRSLWELAAPVLGKLQFPWRWQAFLALSLAVLLALIVDGVFVAARPRAGGRAPRLWQWLAALALGSLAFVHAGNLPPGSATPEVTTAAMWSFDAAHGQVGATWTGEFLPRWVNEQNWSIGRAPQTAPPTLPSVDLQALPVAAGYLDTTYTVTAAAPLTVTLDRFYFPAWQVRVDGTPVTTQPQGALALLAAPIPAGEHRLAVTWNATPAVWAGRLASAAGWALVLAALFLLPARRMWLLAAWSGVGLVALLGVSGISAVTVAPTSVAADFGDLRLEAAHVPAARAGVPSPIRLYWTVTGPPAEVVAFAHVLGPDGAVVAQWDEPLANPYRPGTRLHPGMLVSHTLQVPLPHDLAPGDYPVVAGLYPAGAADAPLMAAGAPEPRVPVGVLTVQH